MAELEADMAASASQSMGSDSLLDLLSEPAMVGHSGEQTGGKRSRVRLGFCLGWDRVYVGPGGQHGPIQSGGRIWACLVSDNPDIWGG